MYALASGSVVLCASLQVIFLQVHKTGLGPLPFATDCCFHDMSAAALTRLNITWITGWRVHSVLRTLFVNGFHRNHLLFVCCVFHDHIIALCCRLKLRIRPTFVCGLLFYTIFITFSSSPLRILIFFSSSLRGYISRVFTALMSSQPLFAVDCICCLLDGGTWIKDNSSHIDAGPIGVWVSSTGKDRLIFSDFPLVLYPSIISLYMFILLFQ